MGNIEEVARKVKDAADKVVKEVAELGTDLKEAIEQSGKVVTDKIDADSKEFDHKKSMRAHLTPEQLAKLQSQEGFKIVGDVKEQDKSRKPGASDPQADTGVAEAKAIDEKTKDTRTNDDIRAEGAIVDDVDGGRKIIYENGSTVTEDKDGRITKIEHGEPPNSTVYDVTYGADGKISEVQRNGEPVAPPGEGAFIIDPEFPENGIVYRDEKTERRYEPDGSEYVVAKDGSYYPVRSKSTWTEGNDTPDEKKGKQEWEAAVQRDADAKHVVELFQKKDMGEVIADLKQKQKDLPEEKYNEYIKEVNNQLHAAGILPDDVSIPDATQVDALENLDVLYGSPVLPLIDRNGHLSAIDTDGYNRGDSLPSLPDYPKPPSSPSETTEPSPEIADATGDKAAGASAEAWEAVEAGTDEVDVAYGDASRRIRYAVDAEGNTIIDEKTGKPKIAEMTYYGADGKPVDQWLLGKDGKYHRMVPDEVGTFYVDEHAEPWEGTVSVDEPGSGDLTYAEKGSDYTVTERNYDGRKDYTYKNTGYEMTADTNDRVTYFAGPDSKPEASLSYDAQGNVSSGVVTLPDGTELRSKDGKTWTDQAGKEHHLAVKASTDQLVIEDNDTGTEQIYNASDASVTTEPIEGTAPSSTDYPSGVHEGYIDDDTYSYRAPSGRKFVNPMKEEDSAYKVQDGDTLSAIAADVLRIQHKADPKYEPTSKEIAAATKKLYEHNKKTIEDPNKIYTGQDINVPPDLIE